MTTRLPSLTGLSVAGETDPVSLDFDGFAAGDRVPSVLGIGVSGHYGDCSELSLAPARAVVRLPTRTSSNIARLSAGHVAQVSAVSSSAGLA